MSNYWPITNLDLMTSLSKRIHPFRGLEKATQSRWSRPKIGAERPLYGRKETGVLGSSKQNFKRPPANYGTSLPQERKRERDRKREIDLTFGGLIELNKLSEIRTNNTLPFSITHLQTIPYHLLWVGSRGHWGMLIILRPLCYPFISTYLNPQHHQTAKPLR